MNPGLRPAMFAALAAGLIAPAGLHAQVVVQSLREDLPVVTHVMPAGLQRGQSIELVVHGERLDELGSLLAGDGVSLVSVVQSGPKEARLQVAVSPDTPIGFQPLHVLCRAGLSNPRLIYVDDLPQLTEQDDTANNTPAGAPLVEVPAAVNGILTGGDHDHYRFHAAAGEQLVLEVQAQRLGTALCPVITLFDAAGHELRTATLPAPGIAPDVRLVHSFTAAGDCVVRVNDLTYQGTDFCVYRLRIGPLPFAAAMFPLGGRRGSVTAVTLEGGSLTAPLRHDVDLTGDVPWQLTGLRIPFQDTTVTAPALFAVGSNPEFVEQEPNNGPDDANPVDSPATLNGRLQAPGDRDCFRFHAVPGQTLLVRVLAEQLGSPLDPIVTIRSAEGNVIATADDRQAASFEPPVVRPATPSQNLNDPLVEFTPPGEGDFVLSIDDLHFRGGPGFAYRIELGPRPTDFELIAQPGREPPQQNRNRRQARGQQVLQQFAGQGTGALSLDRGGSGTIVVRTLRSGYDGPIRLAVEGLPEGVEAAEAVIAAGQNQAVINFTAGFDVPSTAAFARILGSADDGQTALTRPARQPVVFTSLPPNGAVLHHLDAIAVGVSGQGAELALRGELKQPLVQGGTCELLVSIRRREGYSGAVAVTLVNPPSGLEAPPATIPADADQTTLTLTAALDLAPGPRSLLLQGTMPKQGAEEPILATDPLRLATLPWIELELAEEQVDVPQGGSVDLNVVLRRNGSQSSPVELSAARTPRGITIDPVTVPADAKRFSLPVRAAATARPRPIRRIIQLKPTATIDGQTLELPTLRFALKVVKP